MAKVSANNMMPWKYIYIYMDGYVGVGVYIYIYMVVGGC